MKYFKRVEGDKVYLSPVNHEDYEILTEWLNDKEVLCGLLLDTKIITLKNEKEALEKIASDGYHFFIINKSNDELMGICSYHELNLIDRKAEMGIFIGNKKYWNKGFGTEATQLLLQFGFEKLNLNNVMLRVFSFNKNAIKCYQKCGFKMIGKRREAKIVNEKKFDEIGMDIIRSEFKS